MKINRQQLHYWCTARNIPSHLYHEEWIVQLFTISMQLKESVLSEEQKKDLRKQAHQILVRKREECQQAYKELNLQLEIPQFHRIEEFFAAMEKLKQRREQQRKFELQEKRKKEEQEMAAEVQRQQEAAEKQRQQEKVAEQQKRWRETWDNQLAELSNQMTPWDKKDYYPLVSADYTAEDIRKHLAEIKPQLWRGMIWHRLMLPFKLCYGACAHIVERLKLSWLSVFYITVILLINCGVVLQQQDKSPRQDGLTRDTKKLCSCLQAALEKDCEEFIKAVKECRPGAEKLKQLSDNQTPVGYEVRKVVDECIMPLQERLRDKASRANCP